MQPEQVARHPRRVGVCHQPRIVLHKIEPPVQRSAADPLRPLRQPLRDGMRATPAQGAIDEEEIRGFGYRTYPLPSDRVRSGFRPVSLQGT